MKNMLLVWAIKIVMGILSPELISGLWAKLKAKVSDYVAGTDNSVDDFVWGLLQGGGPEMVLIVDTILDYLEDKVLGSASTVDDALVLPVCDLLRNVLNVPDND